MPDQLDDYGLSAAHRYNQWLGIQNLPNGVPARTLQNLNDFAQQTGDIVSRAGEQSTMPRNLVPQNIWRTPTLTLPSLTANSALILRYLMRQHQGLPQEKP